MFKILEEPRPIMHIFDIREAYPNKAFIVINFTEEHPIYKGTYTGEVYAISDEKSEDMQQYYKELSNLREKKIPIYSGNTFSDDSLLEQ